MSEFNWNITKCRAKHKGHKELNYTFYIVDYVYDKWPKEKEDITTLRNAGVVKTVHFMHESQAGMFIHTEGGKIALSEANDKAYVKSIKKFLPKMINNVFEVKGIERR